MALVPCSNSLCRLLTMGNYRIPLLIGVFIAMVWAFPMHAAERTRTLFDGTLIKGSGPRVYVVENGERRWIQTERDFIGLGYRWSMLKTINDDDLLLYPRGEAVTLEGGWPDYTLLKGSAPPIYIVAAGKRRWAKNTTSILGSKLDLANLLHVSNAAIARIPQGDPLTVPLIAGPETTITVGPDHGSASERTDVTFSFRGSDAHGSTNVTFETKIEGYDNTWVGADQSVERRVSLPRLPFPFVFFVRAKDRDAQVDRTPAYRLFTIGHSQQVGSVKIESVNAGSEVPSTEYLELRVVGDYPVDLTGWKLENDRGSVYTLGEAIDEYERTNSFTQHVVVPPQGKVTVSSGRSPLGANIRLNGCAGYLERLAAFTPSINQQCPTPSGAITSRLSRPCQDYLSGLNSCSTPPPATQGQIMLLKGECLDFANQHWTYDQCKSDHRSEPGFFQNEWRLFLGLTNEEFIAGRYEVITLRDPSGKVVDQYTY